MAKTDKKKQVKKTSKSAAKKAPVKKAAAKKTVAKKVAVKKTSAKKAAVKKVTTSKAVKKTSTVKKSIVKAVKKAEPKAVKHDENYNLALLLVEGMQDKKAKNIQLLDLRKIQNRVTDFFVLCDADSNTHVDAIADSVFEMVRKKSGVKPYRSEGFENKEWIVLDYITAVAHIFRRDIREFYHLETLWADAEITNFD